MPRIAPGPQQFQLAAALHSASQNKRTNTQDRLKAFVPTSFKTRCCKAPCHLFLLPRASLNWSTNLAFFLPCTKPYKTLMELLILHTSFLKTSRQAHQPTSPQVTRPKTSSDAGSTFFPAHNFAAPAWLQPMHWGVGSLLYVGAGAFLQLPYRCTSSNETNTSNVLTHKNTTIPNSQSRLGCQDAKMHGYQYQALCANIFNLTPAASAHPPSQCIEGIQ